MFAARTFAGKRVGLFGLARSGLACAAALRAGGTEVLAWDDNKQAAEAAKAEGCTVTNLSHVDFRTLDALILSPGVPLTHPSPHWTVVKARTARVPVIGDTEIFARELAKADARMVAITGTNGKSTTTALIGHVLKECGLDVDIGGNIGTAVFNLRSPTRGRIYVLELSSYQIDLMPSLSPDVGILTNIAPDHLDRHGTFENYAAVKALMFSKLQADATALVSVDDEMSAKIFTKVTKVATRIPVSVTHELPEGLSAHDGILRWQGEQIDLRDMPALKGRHNWQNACMAFGAATHFGIATDKIAAAMRSFPGLAHRMQEIARLGHVAFVNDSKGTNADAAEKALSSYTNIYWIAGGLAKSGGIEALRPLFGNVAHAYLIGDAAAEFAVTLNGKVPVTMSGMMDKAVAQASADAAATGKEAVVLLSPACASFDQYKNFELRGEDFVKQVAQLPGIKMMGSRT